MSSLVVDAKKTKNGLRRYKVQSKAKVSTKQKQNVKSKARG